MDGEKSKTERVLEYLRVRPNQPFSMRSISKDLDIDKMTVSGIIDALCFFGKVTTVKKVIRGNFVCVQCEGQSENLLENVQSG